MQESRRSQRFGPYVVAVQGGTRQPMSSTGPVDHGDSLRNFPSGLALPGLVRERRCEHSQHAQGTRARERGDDLLDRLVGESYFKSAIDQAGSLSSQAAGSAAGGGSK